MGKAGHGRWPTRKNGPLGNWLKKQRQRYAKGDAKFMAHLRPKMEEIGVPLQGRANRPANSTAVENEAVVDYQPANSTAVETEAVVDYQPANSTVVGTEAVVNFSV